MKAIERFNETMTRCDVLVAAFHQTTDKNADLLRFAVVLSVSAFERYVKDAFLEHIVQFDRMPTLNPEHRAAFDDFIEKAGVDRNIWRECYMSRGQCRHPRRTIRNMVRKHLSKTPLQTHALIRSEERRVGKEC